MPRKEVLRPFETKPSSEWSLLNDICDRFEAALRNGYYPSISDQLAAVPENLRGDLALELIQLIADIPLKKEIPADEDQEIEPSGNREGLFDRFVLSRYLGCGGFGFVFLANDTKSGRKVALKIARSEVLSDQNLRNRFLMEAKTTQKLEHPHLVKVRDAGELADSAYVISDYEEGPTLQQVIQEKGSRSDCKWAAAIVKSVALGIQHAHEAGVIHCDLKPANVLLTGEKEAHPKVVDFGIARLVGEPTGFSRTGELFGTPGYVAPEQALGKRAILDERTDVYSLGALLYACLAGHPPFHGDNPLETLARVLRDEPVPPSQFNRGVPPDLDAVCLRCLEKDPQKRYPSAQALVQELDRFLAGLPTQTRPPGIRKKIAHWSRKNPAVASLFLASLVGIVTGFGFLIWHEMSLREINRELSTAVGELGQANSNLKIQRDQAIKQGRLDRLESYAADIRQARYLLDQADYFELEKRLNRWLPGEGMEDIRGFEWHYLKKRVEEEPSTPLWKGQKPVYAVMYSPDGKEIAVAGADRMLRFLSSKTGHEVRPFVPHGGEIGTIDYSRENWVATGCTDGIVRILKPGNTTPIELHSHVGKVLTVAFSGDGKSLATGGFDKRILIWDLTAQVPRFREIGKTENHLTTLAWSPDGLSIYGGESDYGVIKKWSTQAGSFVSVTKIYKGGPVIGLHVDQQDVVSAAFKMGTFSSWKVGSGPQEKVEPLVSFRCGQDKIRSSAVDPTGKWLALARDGRVELWDLARKERANINRGHSGIEWTVAFSPDGRTIVSGGEDGGVRIWPIEQKRAPVGIHGFALESPVSRIGFDSTSSFLIGKLSNQDRLFFKAVREPLSGPLVKDDLFPKGTDFQVTSNGRILAIQPSLEVKEFGPDKQIIPLGQLKGLDGNKIEWPNRWAIPADASWFAPQVERDIFVVQLKEPFKKTILQAPKNTNIVAASTTGLLAACYTPEKQVLVWDALTGRKTREFLFDQYPWEICFSPDGKYLAVIEARMVRVFDLLTGKESYRLSGNHWLLEHVTFSRDGRTLATASYDTNITFWQAETGQELMVFSEHTGPVKEIGFSPDGTIFASVGDRTIGVDLPTVILRDTKPRVH